MQARKLGVAAGLVCCLAALGLAATAGAAPSHRHLAKSRVTIHPFPDGLFGYVKSPNSARCANHRKVVVFRRHSKRGHHRRDRRIVTVRAKRRHGFYQWLATSSRNGTFYAKAPAKPGCRSATSRSLHVRQGAVGNGNGNGGYPPCTPYLSEGTASVCRIEIYATLEYSCPAFGVPHQVCIGDATGGPFPWGINTWGKRPNIQFAWNWSQHWVKFWSYAPAGVEVAMLDGAVSDSSSPAYRVIGFAKGDPTATRSVYFYTPNLPGQAPGEVGGPLHLNFMNGGPTGKDRVEIKGYLYLR